MGNRKRVIAGLVILFILPCVCYGIYTFNRMFSTYFRPPNHPLLNHDISDLSDHSLSHYYVHAEGKDLPLIEKGLLATPPFDSAGIPMIDYHGDIGRQYNPACVAQYAIEHWEVYLKTRQPSYRTAFLKQANWLKENQKNGKWYVNFDWPPSGMKKPWISALNEGQCVSVLLRAFQLTGDSCFLTAATEAIKVLNTSVKEGGVAIFRESDTWLEEYPDSTSPSHVLNGHMWALFGIWDYYRVTGDTSALELFTHGIKALKTDIGSYDTGFWVYYDQRFVRMVNFHYLDFQIDQLKVLFAITHEPIFATYSEKWESYQKRPWNILRIVFTRAAQIFSQLF